MNIGLRDQQEDSVLYGNRVFQEDRFREPLVEVVNDDQVVFSVCDGMGGHIQGERASRFACERLKEKVADVSAPGEYIVDLLKEIQWEFDQSGSEDSGTTIAGIVVEGRNVTIFNAGDSRVYKITKNGMVCVSHDHSFVQDEIDRGGLSPDEAFVHPYKHIINFGLGDVFREAWDTERQHVFRTYGTLGEDEYYFVCSDGVSDNLRDSDMFALLYPSPFERLGGFVSGLTSIMNDNASFILCGSA